MMHYTQLTQEQRFQIYALMRMGHTQTETADVIEVHKSTISRELQRNRGLKGWIITTTNEDSHRLPIMHP